ncbi:MAG: hypothetical protein GX279_08400 [Clostridiaceae bacterium]|jgi:uncharacterized protein YceK|nr:hypothetical protein [Clostridiaceae bacterium]
MKTIIRFRMIFAFLLIISVMALFSGCSALNQGSKKGDPDENAAGSQRESKDTSWHSSYSNDFDSIKQYVETHVQDFRENRENYIMRQADYDVSTEGGTIEGYYSGDVLKYVETHIYGEMGRLSYNVYYIDDSLKYFVETTVQYDNPINNESSSNVISETREEYLIINGRIHEYTSDLKILSETDEANYTELFRVFEQKLKNAARPSTANREPAKAEPKGDDKTLEDLKDEGVKLFEDKAFSVGLDDFGQVTLITGSAEDEFGLPDLKLYLADKDNRLIYEFTDFYGNQWPMLYEVSDVSFLDLDGDGLKDVIVTASYMTGVGEHGAEEFPVAGVYFQRGKEFVNDPELDEKINDAGANTTIDDVVGFLAGAGDSTGNDTGDAIVPVAFNGLLAGSFHDGKWFGVEATVPRINDNIRYSVFSNFEHIGNGTGSLPFTDEHGFDYVTVKREGPHRDDIDVAVEIGRIGDVLSIKPKAYNEEFYFDMVKGFLDQKISGEYPKGILQGISADLDNDGNEEHVISVCSYNDADNLALRGWYKENNNFSYLLLAKETKNGYEISVIAEALRSEADRDSAYHGWINEGEMMVFRSEYQVIGLIDIDGDGDPELICLEDVHEATSCYVYEYVNGRWVVRLRGQA